MVSLFHDHLIHRNVRSEYFIHHFIRWSILDCVAHWELHSECVSNVHFHSSPHLSLQSNILNSLFNSCLRDLSLVNIFRSELFQKTANFQFLSFSLLPFVNFKYIYDLTKTWISLFTSGFYVSNRRLCFKIWKMICMSVVVLIHMWRHFAMINILCETLCNYKA